MWARHRNVWVYLVVVLEKPSLPGNGACPRPDHDVGRVLSCRELRDCGAGDSASVSERNVVRLQDEYRDAAAFVRLQELGTLPSQSRANSVTLKALSVARQALHDEQPTVEMCIAEPV